MNDLIIEAGGTEKNYWRDLWRYRELFLILARRDLTVRYKPTFVAVAWAVIRPFLTMVVFTIVFSKIAIQFEIADATGYRKTSIRGLPGIVHVPYLWKAAGFLC